jgi:hypothetical protein
MYICIHVCVHVCIYIYVWQWHVCTLVIVVALTSSCNGALATTCRSNIHTPARAHTHLFTHTHICMYTHIQNVLGAFTAKNLNAMGITCKDIGFGNSLKIFVGITCNDGAMSNPYADSSKCADFEGVCNVFISNVPKSSLLNVFASGRSLSSAAKKAHLTTCIHTHKHTHCISKYSA